ncbi:N-formylglutamate amidohydrolase [Hypericibacter sp.]|uniref:N-formylglutamate amidohydrolase n=1 Tax=Hypericibacter sp. TaxID=2705401 RepID=UPI003D6CCD05
MSAPVLSEADTEKLAASSIRTINGDTKLGILLICEHAGRRVPEAWADLGLPRSLLDTHFGWDAGAGALTEALAERLKAPAVLANYSRLFLDINRFETDWDVMRPDLAGIPVPTNIDPDPADQALRERVARLPFDQATLAQIARFHESQHPAVVSIHSFTPLVGGKPRATEIGVLWRETCRMGPPVLNVLRREERFTIGDNDPYDWRQVEGYTLRRYALDRDLPCLYLEIRNDRLATARGVDEIADSLAPALTQCIAGLPT